MRHSPRDPIVEALEADRSPNRWLVLLAMTGSLCLIFLDVTVVGVALPRMQVDLGLSESGVQWVMNAYTLTIASMVALGGRVADSCGRVRMFLTGVVLFSTASALAGLAWESGSIIAARIAQGLGAALMQPASSTIVINSFAPGERGKAMGIYVGIPMAFLALGPLIGGGLTELISWRACFLLNLPVAAAAIALTIRARPNDGPPGVRGFSPLAAALYLAGLPTLVFGLQQWGAWGWSPTVVASIVVGASLVVVFVRSEWRRSEPLLAVRLFGERGFLGDGIVLFCMQFAMTGQVIYLSSYFQSALGFSPSRAGAALMPMLLPVIVVVQVAGRMYDRLGARTPVLIGTLLATLGLAVEALAIPTGRILPVTIGMVLFGLGIGFVMSPTNTDALSRVGAAARAQASGLLGTLRQVGGSAGIALLGATVLAVQTLGVRESGASEDLLIAAAARGDPASLAALASESADRLADARAILMRGTAAGQWVAAAAIATAFVVAWLFVDGTPPRRSAAPTGAAET